MDQDYELENSQGTSLGADGAAEAEESVSVDDFIKQLEEKEKDLHITADTSIIEIAEGFNDGDLPETLAEALARDMPKPAELQAAKKDDADVRKLESQIAELRTTIAKMEDDRIEIFKNSQRRAKDFETFKLRAERERKDTFQNQIGNVAMLMLPALDNLHRALDSAEDLPGEKDGPFQQFFDGIALVSEQINEILSKMGIKPIRPIGQEFDPHFHEAVATEETDAFPNNTVCSEILRGYIAGDRVIRHSLVRVAKASQNNSQKAEPQSACTDDAELSGDHPTADSQAE